MIINEDEYLSHIGTPRHSGRYPWGSSGNISQQLPRNASFLDYVSEMRSKGLTDPEIAKGMGISTTVLRAKRSIANNELKQARRGQAQRLHDKAYSGVAAAAKMGIPESSYRALLASSEKDKVDVLTSTSEMLKREVANKTYIDVGTGTENYIGPIGVSKERLNTAVHILKEQGYVTHRVKVRQIGTGLDTDVKVLAPPGTTWGDVKRNQDNIRQIQESTANGGHDYDKILDPISINPKRVSVRYKEDGGADADGVIYIRPGVKDVALGKSSYAQVRVKVGEGHYLKGMAMYKDDLPTGADLIFNTNKSSTGNKLDAMKPIKEDNEGLPFGAVIRRQVLSGQGTSKVKVTSAMNIVNEEGDWADWARTISAQVLSKQSPTLARERLNKTQERRKNEFDEIMELTNPTIKKKLLEKFAEGTDSAAVHLKAAALPRSNWHAILPVDSMPPGQIYAPGYKNGELVVLLRYPHGGTFEIPELKVNNRQPEAKRLFGGARDAVGIHHSVAERLSGADFDGDTVLVIPNDSRKIKVSPALDQLKNFDAKASYKGYEGMPKLTSARKQQLMGDVSNLITDMTLKGASHDKISRAVRHSMVVIDAENHNLNYKQSALDFGIKKLKEEYQGSSRGGASTLISRKKSKDNLPETRARRQSEGGPVSLVTGRKQTIETGRTRVTKDGERVIKKQMYNKLALTDDANTLSSGTPMEKIYAEHSNKLKSLANQARLAAIRTPSLTYSSSANKVYKTEVASLDSQLTLAKMNRPLERQAQIFANATSRAMRNANPNMDSETRTKIEYKALAEARIRTGATKREIRITPKEWNAIQAGAISNHKLSQILDKANIDVVRELATPRTKVLMTTSNTQRAQSLLASGATRAEVAVQLGVSLTTLDRGMTGDGE